MFSSWYDHSSLYKILCHQGREPVYGGGEEERFPESVCTDDANGGDETPIIHDNSVKSLSQAFDKLPEIPPGELASEDIAQLPGAITDALEFSADGAQTAKVAAADCRPLRSCENEKWREAPASLGSTVISTRLAWTDSTCCIFYWNKLEQILLRHQKGFINVHGFIEKVWGCHLDLVRTNE